MILKVCLDPWTTALDADDSIAVPAKAICDRPADPCRASGNQRRPLRFQ